MIRHEIAVEAKDNSRVSIVRLKTGEKSSEQSSLLRLKMSSLQIVFYYKRCCLSSEQRRHGVWMCDKTYLLLSSVERGSSPDRGV